MSTAQTVGQELAEAALRLQIQVNELGQQLDAKKQELRDLANGRKLHFSIENLGKVDITEPRDGSEKIILVINEEKVAQVDGLKEMLIKKGVAEEKLKKTPPARASVRIQPNV